MIESLGLYYRLLAKYLTPQRPRVVVLAVVLLTGIGLQILNPLILRYFIDAVTSGQEFRSLAWVALLFIVLALATQASFVLARYLGEHVAWAATNAMRSDLALHCLKLDISFHYAHTPGELTQRVDGEVTRLANFFSQFVILVVGNLFLLAGVLVMLLVIDWRVSLAFAALGAATLAALIRVQKEASSSWAEDSRVEADLYGFVEERISATEDIRTLGGIPYVMRRFFENIRNVSRMRLRANLMGSLTWSIADYSWGVGTSVAVGLGAYLVLQGSATIGTAYLILHYFTLLGFPLRQITTQMQNLQQASGGLRRINGILGIRSTIAEGGMRQLPRGPLQLEFRNVSFSYSDDNSALSGVSFSLSAGKVLGLLGRTGSGKTTIARLLLRMYDPSSGAVFMAGRDSRELSQEYVRERIGLVTQDVQLFQATVRDNITVFDEGISDDRILGAIKMLGLSDWYSTLHDGLDTMLPSDGGGLSAGQGQLLALARVFLRDPSVIILDEATSRLDPATQQLIEQATDTLLRDRTSVVIAHRLTTVQHADEIMIIETERSQSTGSVNGWLQTRSRDIITCCERAWRRS